MLDKEKIINHLNKKNNLINNLEMEKIELFFKNNSDFQDIISKKEKLYNKHKIKFPIFFSLLFLWNLILYLNNSVIEINILFSILIIVIILYYYNLFNIWNSWFFNYSDSNNIKEKIFSDFIDNMFDWAKFSFEDKYFDEKIFQLKRTWFIKPYDRVKKFNNSLEFNYLSANEKIATIKWIEFHSEKKSKDSKWNTKWSKANHCYIQKIEINSKDKNIFWDNEIKIIDMSSIVKAYYFVLIFVFIISVIWASSAWSISWFLSTFIITFLLVWIFFWLPILLIIKFFSFFYSKKNKVKLEDIEFNKRFKIVAKDQINVRNILDSRTINSIKELTKKFPYNRFDFFLSWNYIYIFIHLNSNFFEFWNYLFLNSTFISYINFYILCREIFTMPEYLYLDYHVN